jgi:uncharacterized membrane protein YccC
MALTRLLHRLPANVINGIAVALGLGLVQLLVGLVAGHLAVLAAVSGAVYASLADQPLAPHRTWRRVLTAGLIGCGVSWLVALLAAAPLWLGLAVALIGFGSTMTLAWGPRAGPISFVGVLALVFTLAAPPSPEPGALWRHVGWTLLGSALYFGWALLSSIWLQPRYRALALSEVLAAVARLLRARAVLLEDAPLPGGPALPLQTWIRDEAALDERLQAARDLLFAARITVQTQRQTALLLLGIDLRDTLLTSELDLDLLGHDVLAERVRRSLARHLGRVAVVFDVMHGSVWLGQPFVPVVDVDAELAALAAEATFAPDDARVRLKTALLDRSRHMDRVLARMQALMQGAEPHVALDRAALQLFVSVEGWPLAALRAQARLSSSVLRHAVRAGLALGSAYFIAMLLPWTSHPYWLVLSVAVVLRGNLEQTLARLNARVAGTVLGCLLVLGLAQLGVTALATAVFLVATGVAHAFAVARYLLTAIAATVMALVQAHLAHPSGGFGTGERLADTLLGAVLAWAFCYVLPAWERRGLPHLLKRLLGSLDALSVEALRWSASPADDLALRLARREVYVALGSLAAVAQRSSVEPERVRLPLYVFATVLMHSHALLAQLATVRLMIATRAGELNQAESEAALQSSSAQIHRLLTFTADSAGLLATLDGTQARAVPSRPPAGNALMPWLQRRLQLAALAAAQVAHATQSLSVLAKTAD